MDNDDLPHFKAVIFKTNSGKLSNGKTVYAAYYPVGDYYRSFIDATRSGYTLVGWKITKVANDSVSDAERISIWDKVEENLELTAVWEKGTFVVEPEEPPVDYEEPTEPEPTEPDPEIIIEQLRQEPVSIPLPPEAEDAPQETGAIRHFRFQKPAFIYYTPYHLPNPQPEPSLTWHIPALACIGAAMVLVVIFPTKKRRPSLYRRGKYMVK